MNMCSKCHKDSMKQVQTKLAASSIGNSVNGKSKESIVSANVDVRANSVDPKTIFMNSIFSCRSQQYDVSDPQPSSFTLGICQNNEEAK
ncbi:hypothetical protein RchiOBHm_Chr7g0209301 [Rosa chinensis]|uniref:Uncharacterized protein n=1 Tax=Rosa chinensis TaxID=74649 RepID=A0A2P6P9Z7_ROSCH|nr:hypothetical protein RchiOBHm_Chr7g0209301 [Rosa chinensis]